MGRTYSGLNIYKEGNYFSSMEKFYNSTRTLSTTQCVVYSEIPQRRYVARYILGWF